TPDAETPCTPHIDPASHQPAPPAPPAGIFGSEGERYVRISLCADVATLGRVSDRISRRV
ncbi:MAG: hypothetical protein K2N86_02580, partial [Rikenellaceae bacterium]|nr:hypothetical protein [Rikenellaceae bacterium]